MPAVEGATAKSQHADDPSGGEQAQEDAPKLGGREHGPEHAHGDAQSSPPENGRSEGVQQDDAEDLDGNEVAGMVDVRIKIRSLDVQLHKSGSNMMSWLYRMLLSAFSERIRASVEEAVVLTLQV